MRINLVFPADMPPWTQRVLTLLGQVTYRDWWARIGFDSPDVMWVQLAFVGDDVDTGERREQHCRKWRISPHMTDAEILQTAFSAALMAEEHECRERFRYIGAPIFSPHLSVPALLARAFHTETRETEARS